MHKRTDSAGFLKVPEDDDTGVISKFELETLEPRILLSGDPVLAELARQSMTDDDLSQSDVSVAYVEMMEVELQTEASAGDCATQSASRWKQRISLPHAI